MSGWVVALVLYFLGLYVVAWMSKVIDNAVGRETDSFTLWGAAVVWPLAGLAMLWWGATGKAQPSNGRYRNGRESGS